MYELSSYYNHFRVELIILNFTVNFFLVCFVLLYFAEETFHFLCCFTTATAINIIINNYTL